MMTKRLLKRWFVAAGLCLAVLLGLGGCEYYNRDIKGYLEFWTATVAATGDNISSRQDAWWDGTDYYCVEYSQWGSGALRIYMSNPKGTPFDGVATVSTGSSSIQIPVKESQGDTISIPFSAFPHQPQQGADDNEAYTVSVAWRRTDSGMAQGERVVKLKCRDRPTDALVLSEPTWDFGTFTEGYNDTDIAEKRILLVNTDDTVTLDNVNIVGGASPNPSSIPIDWRPTGFAMGDSLGPGDSVGFTVKPLPGKTAQQQPYSLVLTITADLAGQTVTRTFTASFTVNPSPSTPTYTVSGLPSSPQNYTVKLENSGGGTVTNGGTVYGTDTLTLTVTPASGYSFEGAMGGTAPILNQLNGANVSAIGQNPQADGSWQWTINSITGNVDFASAFNGANANQTYTVTFHKNDSNDEKTTKVFGAGRPQTLTDEGFTRDGYSFSLWADNSDGTGTGYNVGNPYTATADTDLYAIWVPIEYTISYDLKDFPSGAMNDARNPATYNVETPSITLYPPSTPPDADKAFVGWNADQNGNGKNYPAAENGTTYTPADLLAQFPAGNVTLYAQWMRVVDGNTVTGSGTDGVFIQGRNVPVESFLISDHEVTQGEWAQHMPLSNYNYTVGEGDNYPYYYTIWYEAIVYCNRRSIDEGLEPCYTISGSTDPDQWGAVPTEDSSPNKATWDAVSCDWNANGYRLPTEVEWEYAARGGDPSSTDWGYKYAGSDTVDDVAWYNDNANRESHPVKDSNKQANALGLYDMSGNVWEWCWDWHSGSITNTGAASGSSRVIRGGSWNDADNNCTVFHRNKTEPHERHNNYGFRVVRTVK